jgi:hypothetical protein
MKRVLFLVFLLGSLFSVQAQGVVNRSRLTENLSGQVEQAKNNNGRAMYYEFVYVRTDEATYKWDIEGATKGSIIYRLDFYSDAAQKNLVLSLPIKMRNLLTTYYVDAIFTNSSYPDPSLREKGATLIFKKDVRWARTKFVPHEGCRREEGDWERIDKVESYDQLMNYFVRQLDANILFDCYK